MNIKQKIYLVSGLILVIIILLFWGIIRPLVLEIKTASASLKERNEKLIILEKTDQEYLKQLELDYNDIEEDIALIKSGFLNTDQIVDFFVDLENIASSTFNNLEIEVEEFPFFNLNLLGDFSSLMKFLGWLENSKYFVDVYLIQIRQFTEKELSLEKERPSSVGEIKSVLKIKAYTKSKDSYEEQKILKTD